MREAVHAQAGGPGGGGGGGACRERPNWTSTSVPMVREDSMVVGSALGSRLSSPGMLGALTRRHLSTRPHRALCRAPQLLPHRKPCHASMSESASAGFQPSPFVLPLVACPTHRRKRTRQHERKDPAPHLQAVERTRRPLQWLQRRVWVPCGGGGGAPGLAHAALSLQLRHEGGEGVGGEG